MNTSLNTSTPSKASGFTLIELLVAVAIISLMSSIVLAFVNETKLKATDRSIELLLGTVRTEAEFYHNVVGGYRNNPGIVPLANGACIGNSGFNNTFIRTNNNTGEALTHATIISDALTKAIAQSSAGANHCKVSADGKMYYIALQRKTSAIYVCTDYTGVMKYITTPKTTGTSSVFDFTC